MAKLSIGDKAPELELSDKDGRIWRLKDFDQEFLVIYFYPRDNTPGCTIEARDFTKLLDEFKQAGAAVIGISGGDERSKQKFCSRHQLELVLLSDPDGRVGKSYGAFGRKKFMGMSFDGFRRMTFVFDRKRKLVTRFEKVKAKGHAAAVLDQLREA